MTRIDTVPKKLLQSNKPWYSTRKNDRLFQRTVPRQTTVSISADEIVIRKRYSGSSMSTRRDQWHSQDELISLFLQISTQSHCTHEWQKLTTTLSATETAPSWAELSVSSYGIVLQGLPSSQPLVMGSMGGRMYLPNLVSRENLHIKSSLQDAHRILSQCHGWRTEHGLSKVWPLRILCGFLGILPTETRKSKRVCVSSSSIAS